MENQSSSESVPPRSNPRNNQDGRIQRKTYQTKNKFIKKISKGRKSQFDLLQFIRYNPLFNKNVGDANIESEADKLDVEIVDTEEVRRIKDSAVITRLVTAASAPASSDTSPFLRSQTFPMVNESALIEPVNDTIKENSVDEKEDIVPRIVTESALDDPVENIDTKNSVDEEEISIPIIVTEDQLSTKEIPELTSDDEDDEVSENEEIL